MRGRDLWFAIIALFATTWVLRPAPSFADVLIMVDGKELECEILGEDEDRIEVAVQFGKIQVLKSRILRVEKDTPEIKAQKEAERKAKAEAEAKFAEEQRAKGLVEVDGKWVTPAEAKQVENQKKMKREAEKKAAPKPAAKPDAKPANKPQQQNQAANLPNDRMNGGRNSFRTTRHGSSRGQNSRSRYGTGDSLYGSSGGTGGSLYGYSRNSGSRSGIRGRSNSNSGYDNSYSLQDRNRMIDKFFKDSRTLYND